MAGVTADARAQGSAAPDIEIPSGNGRPPLKTTGPIPPQKYVELMRYAYRGFQNMPHALTAKGAEFAYLTEDRPKIETVVTIAPCSAESVLGACTPMSLDAWKAKEDALKQLIPKELRVASDTKWELGTVKIHDTEVIYTFQLGQVGGVFTDGSNAGKKYVLYSYAYTVYYNDGQNQIRVIAQYKDQEQPTIADMQKQVSRDDLANVAQGFWDALTQHW